MMTIIYILVGIAVNEIVAYCVLDSIDDDDRSLFHWVYSCPFPGGSVIVTQLWPITAWMWLRRQP